MSLAIKYETVDDAKMRLRNTIVLYKGEPVYIRDVARGGGGDEILRVKFTPLPVADLNEGHDPFRAKDLEEEQRKYISSKHFDIAPFKLGYVNFQGKGGAFYVSRLPNRIQKQGLCAENFKGTTNYGGNVGFATFLTCKETLAMIAGRYPSFDEALRALNKVPAVAFDRDFCLVKDDVIPELTYLYHKGSKVGYFNTREVTLGKKFACLKEVLQENRVKVA